MKSLIYRYLLMTAAVVATVSCGGGKPAGNGSDTVSEPVAPREQVRSVEVMSASKKDVPQESSYATTVQAYAVNNIAPQTGGRIRKINADVGDYVVKGQILAQMDRLQLDQTRLQLQNDSTELARVRALYQEGGVAQSDFEQLEMAYKLRKSTYDNLLENTILRSPITGYVTARNFDTGDLFSMSMPLFTVQQVVPVKLLVGISESEYTSVKRGDVVKITVDAIPGREFRGNISKLHPTVNAATHTFNAEVTVQNSDRALRPGMYARATVTFGTNHSIVLPDQAVIKQEGTGQKYVFVLGEGDTVKMVPVSVGRHNGSEYEILDGIAEGDEVVTKGGSGLRDGDKVRVLGR